MSWLPRSWIKSRMTVFLLEEGKKNLWAVGEDQQPSKTVGAFEKA
jgi:hypothetical protein